MLFLYGSSCILTSNSSIKYITLSMIDSLELELFDFFMQLFLSLYITYDLIIWKLTYYFAIHEETGTNNI